MANEVSKVTAVINGVTYNLKLATSGEYAGKWTAEGIAPDASSSLQPGGYYPVTVQAEYKTGVKSDIVNDKSAGALGQGCRLVVRESYAPTMQITHPNNNSFITNLDNQYITLVVKDNNNGQQAGYSGIKLSSLVVKVDGTPVTGFQETAIDGGYQLYYKAAASLGDGAHTITASIEDNDGNSSGTETVNFTIDTVAPQLDVNAPEPNFSTAQETITVTGTTDTTPVIVSVYLNGVLDGEATVVNGSFTYNLTFKEQGNQVIRVVARDTAGLTTEATVSGFFSSVAPVIKSVRLVPTETTSGAGFTIVVDVE